MKDIYVYVRLFACFDTIYAIIQGLGKQNEINNFARTWLTQNFIYLQDTNERPLQTMERNKRQENLDAGYDLEKGILFRSTDFIRLSNEIIRQGHE